MKFICLCLSFLHLAILSVYPQTGPGGVLQLQFQSKPFAAGKTGLVNGDLVIMDGFKIPKRPLPKIQLNSMPGFEIKGEFNFVEEGQGKDPEYFNAFKPLSIQILAADSTQPGKYLFEGKFTYFYCSDTEKYCSRAVEGIRIPLEVVAKK